MRDYSMPDNLGFSMPHRWYGKPGESHYVPSWYREHQNLDLPVRVDGVEQGFLIRDVIPFRRWAIDEAGNTLPQAEFHRLWVRYLDGFKHDATVSLEHEFIPDIREFVSQKLDHNGNLVSIHYNDDGRIVKTERYNQDGEESAEYTAKKSESDKKLAKIQMLAEMHREGAITDDELAFRTKKVLNPDAFADEPSPAQKQIEAEKKRLAQERMAKARQTRLDRLAARRAESGESEEDGDDEDPGDEAA